MNKLEASWPERKKTESRYNGFDFEYTQKNSASGTKWNFYGCGNYAFLYHFGCDDSRSNWSQCVSVCGWFGRAFWAGLYTFTFFFLLFVFRWQSNSNSSHRWVLKYMVGILTSTSVSQCSISNRVSFSIQRTFIAHTHSKARVHPSCGRLWFSVSSRTFTTSSNSSSSTTIALRCTFPGASIFIT